MVLPANESERGFALAGVLISLLVLALIAAALMRTTLHDARLTQATELQTQARYAALSSVELAAYDALSALHIEPDGTVRNYTIGDTIAVVRISDEAGRIDINAANEATLSAAFNALGVPQAESISFAATIADWRDPDQTPEAGGAEAADYQAAGLTYVPRDGPFETLGELREIRGMTDRLFACALPVLTIYNDTDTVNFAVAPQEVTDAYHWADANNWLGEDWSIPPVDVLEQGQIQVVRSDGSGAALRMDILVTMPNGKIFTFRSFVRLTQTNQLPYELLAFGATGGNQVRAACWP